MAIFNPTGEELTDLCAIIGTIALPWAQFEGAMDMCVSMLFEDEDRTAARDGLPVAFKRKVVFLKKKFRHRQDVAHLKAEATEIFSQAKILNKARNDVIHGYVSHYDPAKGDIIFTKLAVRLEDHYEDATPYSVTSLIGIGQKCLDLSSRMIEFNQRVEQAVMS